MQARQLSDGAIWHELTSDMQDFIAEQDSVFLSARYPLKMRMDNGPELVSLHRRSGRKNTG